MMAHRQLLTMAHCERYFGRIAEPDVNDFFGRFKVKYPVRSSSAHWNSPLSDPTPGVGRFCLWTKLIFIHLWCFTLFHEAERRKTVVSMDVKQFSEAYCTENSSLRHCLIWALLFCNNILPLFTCKIIYLLLLLFFTCLKLLIHFL